MKQQQGFSLVELMVALALGLLITAAAVQLFTTNQRTFTLQQVTSRLQENGQLVSRFLVRDLRQVGLELDISAGDTLGILSGSGQSTEAHSDGNDRLALAYHGSEDCTGAMVPSAPGLVENTYYVKDGELLCDGNHNAGAPVVMVSGVDSFQVLYGVDGNEDGELRVSRYVTANNIGSDPVVAVQFALLLKSRDTSLPDAGSETFHVLNETATFPSDNAVRRLFSGTVRLRNYDWDAI